MILSCVCLIAAQPTTLATIKKTIHSINEMIRCTHWPKKLILIHLFERARICWNIRLCVTFIVVSHSIVQYKTFFAAFLRCSFCHWVNGKCSPFQFKRLCTTKIKITIVEQLRPFQFADFYICFQMHREIYRRLCVCLEMVLMCESDRTTIRWCYYLL